MLPSCYETHKPFLIGPNMVITGGSALEPPEGTDYVVTLEEAYIDSDNARPWISGDQGPIFVPFIITDFSVPKNLEEFDMMLEWVIDKIQQGYKVHIGCLGGHGRTGLVLSALRYKITQSDTAIDDIRSLYCSDAVETEEQEKFISELYGIPLPKPRNRKLFGFNKELFYEDFDFKDFNDLEEMEMEIDELGDDEIKGVQ